MCETNVIFLVLRSGFDRQYDTVQILQAGVVRQRATVAAGDAVAREIAATHTDRQTHSGT
jgi:hypothetical protein